MYSSRYGYCLCSARESNFRIIFHWQAKSKFEWNYFEKSLSLLHIQILVNIMVLTGKIFMRFTNWLITHEITMAFVYMKTVAIQDKRKPSSQIVIFVYYIWCALREMIQSSSMVYQHIRTMCNVHGNGIMTIKWYGKIS